MTIHLVIPYPDGSTRGGGPSAPGRKPGGMGNGKAAVDEMLTIDPLPCSQRYGTTALDAWTMPMKLTARNSSHVAVSWSNIRAALFTRQSTRPRSATTF